MLLLIPITVLHPTKVKAPTNFIVIHFSLFCCSFCNLMLIFIPLHVKVKAIKLFIVICYSLFLFYCFDAAFHFTLVKHQSGCKQTCYCNSIFIVFCSCFSIVLMLLLFPPPVKVKPTKLHQRLKDHFLCNCWIQLNREISTRLCF